MMIANKITGNYSPYNLTRQNVTPRVKKFQEMLTTTEPKEATNVSTDEKKYFIGMYPDKAQEISEYHAYNKSGKMNGIQVGTLFDQRG